MEVRLPRPTAEGFGLWLPAEADG